MRRIVPSWIAAVVAAGMAGPPAHALPARLHATISYEAAQLPGVPEDLRNPEILGDPDIPLRLDGSRTICKGAYDEDVSRYPTDFIELIAWWNEESIWRQGTHFWDPAAGPEGGHLRILNPEPRTNAWQRARILYEHAVDLYDEDPAEAWHTLGRVAHLLQDVATPAHTLLDPHLNDAIALFLRRFGLGTDAYEKYTKRLYVTRPETPGVGNPAGRLAFEADFPPALITPVEPTSLDDGGHPELGPLFALFHSMATHAAQWDSNDRNGRGGEGFGGGSLRWPTCVDIPFQDAATIEVWQRSRWSDGTERRILPIATLDEFRILLPAEAGLPFTELIIRHDGTETRVGWLRVRRLWQISDADCARMAADLMPRTIAHTAALYRLFWDDTHR